MPLYDIHCADCDTISEVLTSHHAQARCPSCGSSRAHRLVSGVAPPGQSKTIARNARAQARREGHLSNF